MTNIQMLLAALFSAFLALVLLPAMIRLSERFDLYDFPGRHKRHKRPVSFLGGAALYGVMWITIVVASFISNQFFDELSGSIGYIYLGTSIVFLIGLIDDLRPLSAWAKLLAQVTAGVALYAGGMQVDPISLPLLGQLSIGSWSLVITVAWVVALTNAVNLIDGLDGLATGVSLIAAVTLAIVGYNYSIGGALIFAIALIGFLSVFIFFNRSPARVFLGDSGSLQIGFYFAVISLVVPLKSYTAAALYVPMLALGVPLLEAASSFLRRFASGSNILQADRRHLFHYLAHAGLGPRQIVLVFCSLSVLFGLAALGMLVWDRVIVISVLALFMVVIFIGFFIFVASSSRAQRKRLKPR